VALGELASSATFTSTCSKVTFVQLFGSSPSLFGILQSPNTSTCETSRLVQFTNRVVHPCPSLSVTPATVTFSECDTLRTFTRTSPCLGTASGRKVSWSGR